MSVRRDVAPGAVVRSGNCAVLLLSALGMLAGCGRPPAPQTSEIAPIDRPASGSVAPPAKFASTDWPAWRGPQGTGIAAAMDLPVSWSDMENVVWKSKIPGRGYSSPIVLGDRVYLETADEGAQSQSVLAVSLATGKWIWQTVIFQGNLEQAMHAENTQASSTLATDGERLFATFLNDRRIYCSALTVEGEELWRQEVGGFQSRFGYSASPIVYEDLVIVAADHEGGGFIAGLNRATGDIVWRRKRPTNASYATPGLVVMDGRPMVVLCGCKLVTAYDPRSGEEVWKVDGTTESTVGSPVTVGHWVVTSGGYPGAETIAVGARGNVGWRVKEKVYVPSLLAYRDVVYLMQDDGVLRALDGANGKELWKRRIGGTFRVSPLAAGDHIYVADSRGKTTVFKASREKFEQVAENQLGTEAYASPAVSGRQLLMRVADDSSGRRQEWLYCLEEGATSARPAGAR